MSIKELQTPTDRELISEALHDKQQFAKIVDRYEAALKRYLVRLGCRDSHDAQDILQNVFIKVYVNLNDYDSTLKFSSWLYRITHNEAIDFFRKRKVRPIVLQHQDMLRIFESLSDETDISESLHRKQNNEVINKALLRLESLYRDVLILRFLEEKSYDDISDILKVPAGTVAIRINRGKKLLRKILDTKM